MVNVTQKHGMSAKFRKIRADQDRDHNLKLDHRSIVYSVTSQRSHDLEADQRGAGHQK